MTKSGCRPEDLLPRLLPSPLTHSSLDIIGNSRGIFPCANTISCGYRILSREYTRVIHGRSGVRCRSSSRFYGSNCWNRSFMAFGISDGRSSKDSIGRIPGLGTNSPRGCVNKSPHGPALTSYRCLRCAGRLLIEKPSTYYSHTKRDTMPCCSGFPPPGRPSSLSHLLHLLLR